MIFTVADGDLLDGEQFVLIRPLTGHPDGRILFQPLMIDIGDATIARGDDLMQPIVFGHRVLRLRRKNSRLRLHQRDAQAAQGRRGDQAAAAVQGPAQRAGAGDDGDAQRNAARHAQAALQLRARLRGFEMPEDVCRFLLKRLDREMRSLFMTLDQLDHASITAQRKLTIPFVKEILKL